jgi:TonB family protein
MFRFFVAFIILLGWAFPANAQSMSPELEYGLQISKTIQSSRNYPPEAKAQFRSGLVVLELVVDSKGQIVSSRIKASSCYSDFDAEALAMVRRAAPLPPFPSSITKSRLTFVQPITFAMNPAIAKALRVTACSRRS